MFIFYIAHYSLALVTLNWYSTNKWRLLKLFSPFGRAFCMDTSFKPLLNHYMVSKHVFCWHWASLKIISKSLLGLMILIFTEQFPSHIFFSIPIKVEKWEKTNNSLSGTSTISWGKVPFRQSLPACQTDMRVVNETTYA